MLGYTSFSLGGAASALDHVLPPSQGQMTVPPTECWVSTDLPRENSLHLAGWLQGSSSDEPLLLALAFVGTRLPTSLSLFHVLHERHSRPLRVQRLSQEDYDLVSSCSLSFSWYMEWLQIEINLMYQDIKSYCSSVAKPNAVLTLKWKRRAFLKRDPRRVLISLLPWTLLCN